MTISAKDYASHLDQVISDLTARKAKGESVTALDCVATLLPAFNNKAMQKFAVNVLGIDTDEYKFAAKRRRAEYDLGEIPQTTREYIDLLVKSMDMTASY